LNIINGSNNKCFGYHAHLNEITKLKFQGKQVTPEEFSSNFCPAISVSNIYNLKVIV
jgi:hypothetical protein